MTTDVRTVAGDRTVADFVEHEAMSAHASSFPIVDHGGYVEGLVTLRRLRQLPRSTWAATTLREVAVPLDRVAVARPDELLVDAMSRAAAGDRRVLVVVDGQVVGIVTPSDLAAAVERLSLVHPGR
jgi:CBS-domain-containing membrane protein